MVKRMTNKQIYFTCLLVMSMMLSMVFPSYAKDSVVNQTLVPEQAYGTAPDVKVYVTGTQAKELQSVTGAIDDITLTQSGDITTFEQSGDGIRYVVLLDNSASPNQDQFKETKKQLKELRNNLRENDQLAIYTVGVKDATKNANDVLGRTALGSETDQKKADCKKIDEIKQKQDAKTKTVLYRTLNTVIDQEETSKASYENNLRTVILLLTDGEDDSLEADGKTKTSKKATVKKVMNASIPVYGIVLHRTESANFTDDDKKIIRETKKEILNIKGENSENTRGYGIDCSESKKAKKITTAFSTLNNILMKETYVVHLQADTNTPKNGVSEMSLSAADKTFTKTVAINYSNHVADTHAPYVKDGEVTFGKNTITFTLLDEDYSVNESDARDTSNYVVTRTAITDAKGNVVDKKDKKNGKEKDKAVKLAVEDVATSALDSGVEVTLTLKQSELYNGKYSIAINGIRDTSADGVAMSSADNTYTFEVTGGIDYSKEKKEEFVKKYWWIALVIVVIIILLIIGIIVISITKKKSVKVVEVDPNEFTKADSKQIRLTITDRAGVIKDVEWNVEGSLFVGRSDICNIFFDDDRLSKQHFVIEVTKMGCYIEDLESTNGTFVNGVRMTNRRLLLDGDVITAGREKLVFHTPKNQVFADADLMD